MLLRHPRHRMTALAGVAVLAMGMLAGAATATPRPAAAKSPLQAPDLTVALTPDPTAVEPQEKMTFDATVRFRNGPLEPAPKYVYNVVLDVRVPAGSTIRDIQPDGQTPMTCSKIGVTAVRCQVPQMSDQKPVTTTVTIDAPAVTGSHTATAQVKAPNTVQELVETNNTATATVQVRQMFSPAGAGPPDLTVRRLNYYSRRLPAGQTADIEFEVQNQGARDTQGVIVRAKVGDLLAIVSANLSGNACSALSTIWTCTLDLPAGGGPVRLGMTVAPNVAFPQGVSQSVIITAEIDQPNAFLETDESNNTATAAVVVG